MLIFIPSAAILVFLVVFPASASPILGKAFELDSNDVGFNALKEPEFSDQFYGLPVRDSKDELGNDVVRLLKENRMWDNSPEQTFTSLGRLEKDEGFRRYKPDARITSGRADQKRNLKFNPTGWRKKRSVGNSSDFKQFLEGKREYQHKEEVTGDRLAGLPSRQQLSNPPSVIRRSNGRSYQRLDDIIAHIRSLLAKRKGGPLDFNPTGW